MIFGVDNINQIENEAFRKKENISLFEEFVKPVSNQATKELHPSKCERIIIESDVICLFGLSIGETDTTWWQKIADWLTANPAKILIIYAKGQDVSQLRTMRKRPQEREIKNLFLSRTKLSDEVKGRIEKQILVVINSDMFKIESLPKKIKGSTVAEVASSD